MQIKILKVRNNAKIPVKAHEGDAGFDVFYCPTEGKENVIYDLPPGSSCLIPTGIRTIFPSDYMIEIKNKGGIAAKKQLIVGSCVVDSSYRGEIFVNLHNIGKHVQFLDPGDKIAQMVPIFIGGFTELIEVNEEEYNQFDTSRGEGCLGSTGEK